MTQRVVTLDFGSSGIRAVQFALGKNRTKAEKIGFAPLMRGAIEAGEIKDSAAVTVALKDLWETHKFQTKKVSFAVGNASVLVREMVIDSLPHAELLEALGYQVHDEMGLELDDFTLDYHILDEFDAPYEDGEEDEDGESSRPMARVLLVAALSEMIAVFTNTLQAADLVPVHADLIPFAATRAITSEPGDPTTAEAIVEIGADMTTIVVHQDGQPRYVRTYPGQGGNVITDELMRVFGWKRLDAESTKYAVGIRVQPSAAPVIDSVFAVPVDEPAEEITEEQQALEAITDVITNVASRSIQEIRETLSFFLETNGQITTLSRVVLSGGGSLLNGLAPRLASELRVRIDYATPKSLITVGDQTEMPAGVTEQQLTVPIGLALGASS